MPGVGRVRRLGAGIVALALAAACSSGGGEVERSDDMPARSSDAATTKGGVDAAGDAGADADADADADGEGGAAPLRLGLAGPFTFDPAAASPASTSAMVLADVLHDTLTELDADGVPQRGLADFVPNGDLTVWRFTIVEGATFGDGTPIEAGDVVTSLERIRAQGGSTLAAIGLEDVSSVAAIDPRTVEVALARPSALLPERLSSPLYGVIDAEHPPGAPGTPVNPSSRYQVLEASAERLLLERRGGAGPARLVLSLLRDDEAAHAALVAGDVDWAPVPVDRLGALGDDADAALAPFHATVLLGMRTGVEPLTRPALRQAIALAVDRSALSSAVFGPAARPANGLVPAGVPGASDACAGPCGPDPERARQLVAEAFPESPPQLQLLTDQTPTHDALAAVLAEQLAAIGLSVQVEDVDAETYAARLGAGQAQLFLTSALGVARSPASHLRTWASGSPDNLTGYRNELVDVAIDAAIAEPDRALRMARWREIETAILADAPVVPLVQLHTVAAVRRGVEGLVVRADGSIDLSGVALPAR